MAIKFIIGFMLFAAATQAAVVVKTAAPVAAVAAAPVAELEEYDPHPQYQYGYDVQDSLSGDSKAHVEERDGDVVRGEYSFIEADGLRRTVSYTADPINGFNAVVRREPVVVAAAPAALKVAPAPIVRAAPFVQAAPVVRAAPIVQAAPVVRAAPIVQAAPAFRAAPIVQAAPAFRAAPIVQPAPLLRAAPIVRAAPLVAAPAPAPLYRSAAFVRPAVVRSAPLLAPAPLAYTVRNL